MSKKKDNKKIILKKTALILTSLIFVFAAILLTQLLFSVIFRLFKGDGEFTTIETASYGVLTYASSAAIIIIIPKQIKKQWKSTRESLGLKDLPTFTDIGLVIAELIVFLVLSSILTKIFSLFPWFDMSEAQDIGFSGLYLAFDRIVAFFALCILAPIAEEIIFRGWLYGKLREIIPGKKLSIVLSIFLTSLLFAILHGQWNVGVTVFALSVVMCIARELTGTIYSGILLHILKNTIAFALVFVML